MPLTSSSTGRPNGSSGYGGDIQIISGRTLLFVCNSSTEIMDSFRVPKHALQSDIASRTAPPCPAVSSCGTPEGTTTSGAKRSASSTGSKLSPRDVDIGNFPPRAAYSNWNRRVQLQIPERMRRAVLAPMEPIVYRTDSTMSSTTFSAALKRNHTMADQSSIGGTVQSTALGIPSVSIGMHHALLETYKQRQISM